jgi:hypothetical protein
MNKKKGLGGVSIYTCPSRRPAGAVYLSEAADDLPEDYAVVNRAKNGIS